MGVIKMRSLAKLVCFFFLLLLLAGPIVKGYNEGGRGEGGDEGGRGGRGEGGDEGGAIGRKGREGEGGDERGRGGDEKGRGGDEGRAGGGGDKGEGRGEGGGDEGGRGGRGEGGDEGGAIGRKGREGEGGDERGKGGGDEGGAIGRKGRESEGGDERGRGGDEKGRAGDEGRGGGGGGGDEGEGSDDRDIFLLRRAKMVMRGEAGEVSVVRGYAGRSLLKPMHIGFINMEPKSLLIPQYLDSNLIIFLRAGEAKIGLIYEDKLVKRGLKIGDVYRIPAGSPFYIVNTGHGQRLQMICSIDPEESTGIGLFQPFFIGGGLNPKSVLAGFDQQTLLTAFNVTSRLLADVLANQQAGPIVYANATDEPGRLASLMELKHLNGLEQKGVEEDDDEEELTIWGRLTNLVFGSRNKKAVKLADPYNIFDRDPDYRNNYGSSLALDDTDYEALKHAGIGVYFVNLTAGSMMAPHMNPTATEYGIVLRGSGTVQIVYPNGTRAMNAEVNEGDVFWVPRYFAFCQIASRNGPMEFFGFTTQARKNRPHFLVGQTSILKTMLGPELAASFGVSEKELDRLVNSQNQSVILPAAPASPPPEHKPPVPGKEKKKGGKGAYKPPVPGKEKKKGGKGALINVL